MTNVVDLRGAHAGDPCCCLVRSDTDVAGSHPDYAMQESFYFDEREARHGGIEIVSYPRPFPHPPPYVRNPAVGSVSGTLARFH